eukprot:1799678-Pyramimonas_sp.AAC.1
MDQNVALALEPRTFVSRLQELHGWSAVPFQNVVLAVAPRTFASRAYKSFTGARVMLIRGGESPGIVFWRDSRSRLSSNG